MEYTSVNSISRTSRAKVVGLIALAVVGALVASYAVFNSVPAKTELIIVKTDVDLAQLTKDYQSWKLQHRHNFDTQEDAIRFNNYAAADQLIKEQNLLALTYKLAHNRFSHLSNAEHAAINLGLHLQIKKESEEIEHSEPKLPTITVPVAIDWSTKGAVTPIKDQGSCGASWSFAATSALEALAFIKTGILPILSEQQLIDCSSSYGNAGCNGGWITNAWQHVISFGGLVSEASYPYRSGNIATASNCLATGKPFAFKNTDITTYYYVTPNSPSSLIAAIAQRPVSIAIQADEQIFQYYSSGIISGAACGIVINHGALAVGYDQTEGYIKIKNSWGTSWGESGYARLAITASGAGTCGIHQWGIYPS